LLMYFFFNTHGAKLMVDWLGVGVWGLAFGVRG
jgi:hypothetical protein